MQKRGWLDIRELMRGRKRKTHNILAWKSGVEAAGGFGEKEERVRSLLETERGPLPLPQVLKLAKVSRGLLERMLRDGLLETWEESIDPAEDPFDAGIRRPGPLLERIAGAGVERDSRTI